MSDWLERLHHEQAWGRFDRCPTCRVAPGAACVDMRVQRAGRYITLLRHAHKGRPRRRVYR